MAEEQKSDAAATRVSEEAEAKQPEAPLETKVALPKVPFEPIEAPPVPAEQKPAEATKVSEQVEAKLPEVPLETKVAELPEQKPAPAATKVSEQVVAKLPAVPPETKQKAAVAKKRKVKARIDPHRLPSKFGPLEGGPLTIVLVATPMELSPTQNNVTLTPEVPEGVSVRFGDPRAVRATTAEGVTTSPPFTRVSDTELQGSITLPAGTVTTVTITAPVNVTMAGLTVPGQGSATVVYADAMVPVTPPSTADLMRALTAALDAATLTVQSPSDGLLTRVPLLPLSAFVTLPSGPLMASSVPIPLPIGGMTTVVRVDFTFTWTVDGVPALPIERPDGSTLAAGPTDAPRVTVRPIPPVVHVPADGASPAGARTARIACHLEAHAVGTDVRVTKDLAAERSIALPLPRVLALYRAPDMGTHYPAWRQKNVDAARNSGAVVFGAPAELAAPAPPLSGILPSVPIPSPFSALGGLGERLFEIAGPVPTLLGVAGLAALPSPTDTPAELVPVVDPLRRLADAIGLLTGSFAALATLNPGHGTFARLDAAALVQDLAAVHFIDGEGVGTLAVHVQDEAEAAILLGPTGATADLFVLGQLRTAASGVFFHDSGTAQLATAADGFVAVVPDLAIVGPMNGDSSFGWLPSDATTYDSAHARPPDDRFGSITVTNQIDEDRSAGSDPPDAQTTDVENQRRKNTPARTISSLRIN